jgi:hypothetical protein
MSEREHRPEPRLKRGDDCRDPPDGGLTMPPSEPIVQDSDPPKRGGDGDNQ